MTERLNDQPERALRDLLESARLINDVPDIDHAFAARLESRVVAAARAATPSARRRTLARMSGIASLAAVLLLMVGLTTMVIDGRDQTSAPLVSAPSAATCDEYELATPDLTALANTTFVPVVATPRGPYDSIARYAVRYFPEPGSTNDPILIAFVSQLRSCIQMGYNPIALKQYGAGTLSYLMNLQQTAGTPWVAVDRWSELIHQPISQDEKDQYLAALDGAMMFRSYPSGMIYIAFPKAGNDQYWPGLTISSLEASTRNDNDAQSTDHLYAEGPILISNNPNDAVYADISFTDPTLVLLPWEVMPAYLLDATPPPVASTP